VLSGATVRRTEQPAMARMETRMTVTGLMAIAVYCVYCVSCVMSGSGRRRNGR